MRPLALAWLVAIGCVIPDLDVTRKSCPCAGGFICDIEANTCVSSGGQVKVSNLRAEWSTPNQIRWVWDVSVPDPTLGPALLRSYQLVLARTPDEVTARTGSAIVFVGHARGGDLGTDDSRVNPELDRYNLPRSTGIDVTSGTITDGLDRTTTYWAQLVAIDSSNHASTTNVVSGTTLADPVACQWIFDDTLRTGYLSPSALKVSTSRPARGTAHLDYIEPPPCPVTCPGCCDHATQPSCPVECNYSVCNVCCPPGSTACWENLKIADQQLSLPNYSINDVQNSAYFELAIASNAPVTSFWSQVTAWFYKDGAMTTYAPQTWYFAPWTVRADDRYRTVQVPLHALQTGMNAHPAVSDVTNGLGQFYVGGAWPVGAEIRLDSIQICH